MVAMNQARKLATLPRVTITYVYNDASGGTTQTALAAQAAGYRVVIVAIDLAANVSNTYVTIDVGDESIQRGVGVNNAWVVSDDSGILFGDEATAVTITSSVISNVSGSLTYVLEPL